MIKFKIQEASEIPMYQQVKDSITAAIRDGRIKPLTKLPSVSQIAEEAGVSLRTADMALQALIQEGICFRRPKKGTFVSTGKRVIKQRICGVLGYVDPVASPLQSLLCAGLMEASIRKNVPTLTIPISGNYSFENCLTVEEVPKISKETVRDGVSEQMIRLCDSGRDFDLIGIFIIDSRFFGACAELAAAFPEKRFFLLNYEIEGLVGMPDNMAAVVNDNYGGACEFATKVFSVYSPKTVTFLTMTLPKGDIAYRERERGIRDAAASAGVKVTETVKIPHCGFRADQVDFAYEAVLEFLKSQKTDFIFTANDLFAQGVKKAVKELGLKTGVGGYDGVFSSYDKSIPTVRVPYEEMGKIGLEKMLDPEFKMHQIIKLKPEIIINGGTGDTGK